VPACDGPLFKGKHVAVIGGSNSGVEAGVTWPVWSAMSRQYDTALRADAVLVRKLQSLLT
jgi:alkyl hydroperoxide reductase subunit F